MTGVARIAAERANQVADGWTLQHDRQEHPDGDLHDAAWLLLSDDSDGDGPEWAKRLWRKYEDDRVQRLIIAGALIAAELDRLYEVESFT